MKIKLVPVPVPPPPPPEIVLTLSVAEARQLYLIMARLGVNSNTQYPRMCAYFADMNITRTLHADLVTPLVNILNSVLPKGEV